MKAFIWNMDYGVRTVYIANTIEECRLAARLSGGDGVDDERRNPYGYQVVHCEPQEILEVSEQNPLFISGIEGSIRRPNQVRTKVDLMTRPLAAECGQERVVITSKILTVDKILPMFSWGQVEKTQLVDSARMYLVRFDKLEEPVWLNAEQITPF